MIRPNTATARARLLILDDDRFVRQALAESLLADGYDVTTAATLSDALAVAADAPADVVLADLDLPGVRPGEALADLRRRCGEADVIVMSRYDTADADAARGAAAVLRKPLDEDAVREAVDRAVRQQTLRGGPASARATPADDDFGLIGRDARLLKVIDTALAVAAARTGVLILGESGTGKSRLAQAIHGHSPRRHRPFVEVACGSLPDTLLESELFGHVKGSFTGATADKPGRFVSADGGTIFLDEINSAPPPMQVKLLRVLQDRRLEALGSDATRTVDVRTIVASNEDLAEKVAAGTFRQDLFYRVNVVTLRLPPLRERPGDVPLLAESFLRKFADEAGRRVLGFTAAALSRLGDHAWPGNVRELENAVERAVVLGRRPLVDADDLPETVGRTRPVAPAVPEASGPPLPLAVALEGPEKRIIEHALARNGWNRNATAAELAIDRTTLYKKMRKHGLDVASRT